MSESAGNAAFKPDGIAPALRHRNFRLFFGGQTISVIGTWMQTTAMGWLVWRLTQDTAALGIITFASQIPNLIFTPLAGVLADRYPRQRLIILTQSLAMVQAFVLTWLTWTDRATIPLLATLAFSLGVINSFDMPTRQSFSVEMVGKQDLPNAIALNSLSFNLARIIGPPIAGILINFISEGTIFFVNGVSYVVVIFALFQIRLASASVIPRDGNMGQNLKEAFDFVRRNAALRDFLLYIGLISLMGFPYQVLMPAIASQVFHRGSEGYAALLAAIGCGALIGGFVMLRGGFGISLTRMIPLAGFCFGGGLFFLSFSHIFWLSAAILVPAGSGMMIQTLSTNTLLQKLVPDRLRGRVMSFYTMMLLGLIPIGSYFAGYLAKWVGLMNAVRIGGATCALGGLVIMALLPKIRASARLLQGQSHTTI